MREKLIEICKKNILQTDIAILREPYIPFIPDDWNGLLVLAEAQNLSSTNQSYVDQLLSCSSYDRICRFKHLEDVGVQPWDDGSIKIAIEASLGVNADQTAVSNAVLWSRVKLNRTNDRPNDELVERSVAIWLEILEELNPKKVLTVGKIAENIIAYCQNEIHNDWKHFALRSPSPSLLSRVSGMFDESDLLERYPEVRKISEEKPKWFETYRKNKIFFACHAVSLLKTKKTKINTLA